MVGERGKAKGLVHGVFSTLFYLRMALDIVWAGIGAWGFGFCNASIDTYDGVSGAEWVCWVAGGFNSLTLLVGGLMNYDILSIYVVYLSTNSWCPTGIIVANDCDPSDWG